MWGCWGGGPAPDAAPPPAAAQIAAGALTSLCERVARRLHHVVDLRLGVDGREDGVERGGGREVDAAAEEVVRERPEAVWVDGSLEVPRVVDGVGVLVAGAQKEELEHRPDVLHERRGLR